MADQSENTNSPPEVDPSAGSAAAKRAAATRRENKILPQSPYGRLLLALREARKASDQAKSRAADNKRYSEYHDGSKYRYLNYRGSRDARARDYERKKQAISDACMAAGEAGVPFGWANNDDNAQLP